jgi:hypothetical protein
MVKKIELNHIVIKASKIGQKATKIKVRLIFIC